MGASKNTAIQLQESEPKHISEVIKEASLSPRDLLIQQLINKTYPMSYSKLKNLDSPVNFINSQLKPKEKNAGMSFGSLVDCMVLEEHKLTQKFVVLESAPTSDNQKNFVNYFLNCTLPINSFDERVAEAFAASYKKGGVSQVEHLFDYLKALESGKEAVSREVWNRAEITAETLKNAPEVADELALCESFQKFIEFDYMGWHFRGILDTYSPEVFHDMKFASNANPDDFARDIQKFGYDIQFGLYIIGLEILGLANDPKFKYILYDDKGNYSVPEVGEDYISHGKKKVDFLIGCLNRMVEYRAFEASYGFFKSKNRIYKPNWIKGFDYEIFND